MGRPCEFCFTASKKKTSHADLHPFAAGIDDLLGALEEAVQVSNMGQNGSAAWLHGCLQRGLVQSFK